MKILELNLGFQSSLHMHPIKRESFLVIHGVVVLELEDSIYELQEGDSITIESGVFHRFRAKSLNCQIVEASTFHDDADVIRKENSRKL